MNPSSEALKALAEKWKLREQKKFSDAEKEQGDFGRRLIEHGVDVVSETIIMWRSIKTDPPKKDMEVIVAGYIDDPEWAEQHGKPIVAHAFYDADDEDFDDHTYLKPSVIYLWWREIPSHPYPNIPLDKAKEE